MARNGPPVARPGLGSHVSSWLAPPASHSRMTRFSLLLQFRCQSGALQGIQHRHVGGERHRAGGGCHAEEAAAGKMSYVIARSSLTRSTSGAVELVVESAFAAGQQSPDQLRDRIVLVIAMRFEILIKGLDFFRRSAGASKDVPNRGFRNGLSFSIPVSFVNERIVPPRSIPSSRARCC